MQPDDEVPLSQFLNGDFLAEYAVSRKGFSETSWNILRRTMMKLELGNADSPRDCIEIQVLKKLTLLDIRSTKHAGIKRIENVISELRNLTSAEVITSVPIKEDGQEILPPNSDNTRSIGVHKFILRAILLSEGWREEFRIEFGMPFEYSIFDDEAVAREVSIFEARVKGETLASIGERYGVSRERIRQIVEKAYKRVSSDPIFEKKSLSQILNQQKKSFIEDQVHKYQEDISQILNHNPGLTYDEIASSLNLEVSFVRSHISYQASKFVFQEQSAHEFELQYSDEFTIGAIKMAAAIRSPLTAPMYEKLLDRGIIKGPRSQMIAKRFGTWSNACKIAGVMYTHSVRGEYIKTWTDIEALGCLIEFLKNKEYGLGVLGYDDWRSACRQDAPSSAHLRNMFNTWVNAKNSALELMRKQNISCDLM